MSHSDVFTTGGRRLRYEVSGARDGVPVFLLHGTPGSRIGPKPRAGVLYRLGVRLISYDRPGYGGSDRHRGRTVADCAADVAAIAGDLGLDTFTVVGRSGGGPHALATAALLPDRVTRAAVLVSLAPHDAEIDWFGGMMPSNVEEFGAASQDEPRLVESLRLQADRTRRSPVSLLDSLRREIAGPDLQVVRDLMMQQLLVETYAEATRGGPYGWIDDVLAARRDWGFDLGDIHQRVRVWHGAEDNCVPPAHARWLAERIPGAELTVQTGTAHFGAMEILPEILSWLAEPALVA
ncbi:alpha/beta fold hydrolase [Paractinoplanes hotanensis]|uniref:Alpha/beta hydrolase n=1 Tax=Paractinoplanes hotanensis TaxID=2906497 RepID=A0ABT0Y2D8_9ACTN|nr:alpha/beta hydrolase [Actinoplanes hotanensis]MCM4080157.1 alpha/beta hydrolase [Actinoplanes hotanensis]